MERELLIIVEALEGFKTTLLWYDIEVRTNHKNVVHKTMISCNHVFRWRIIIEEYSSDIFYSPIPKNTVVDELSKLHMINDVNEKQLSM